MYFINGFHDWSRVLFTGNSIFSNGAQGLTLVGSILELEGRNHIKHNQDHYGGGIAMHGNSQLWIRNGSHLTVSNNHAFVSGGGIFIHNPCTLMNSSNCPCFFQFIGSNGQPLRDTSVDTFNASVSFHQNTAVNHANKIFNTNSDHCWLKGSFQNSIKTKLFHRVFGIPKKMTQEDISSIPRRICNCSQSKKAGSTCMGWRKDPLSVYPGQKLTLNVMLIGDMMIPIESVLYVRLLDQRFNATDTKQYVPFPLHSTNVLRNDCNRLTIPPLPYQAKGTRKWVLQLMVPLLPDRNQNIFLSKYLPTKQLPYPQAYMLLNSHCKCYTTLSDMNVNCLLEKQAFALPKNYWIGTEPGEEENSTKVLLSTNCPRVYCTTTDGEKNVSLKEPNKQCRHGRTGVLCGQCPSGKSVTYNSYACTTCTNWGILLLVLLLIAGPLLIAIICCLNLTISVGSINGSLLYINILAINNVVLANLGDGAPGLPALGIEFGICIYDGMDAFASTLLSYLFPVYLLTLVGVICLLPKCKCVNMHKINRRIGPRITPVLATIILISYTQLAESVIHSLLYVQLFSTNGTTTTSSVRWMFDGSLEYFHSPKHIILACLALLVLTCSYYLSL